ncbi:MAG TPA: hypothetical protein VJW20_20380 [Candidatus Angelobacter sp.]|nr:hypothetical protein [Candidatus Angelobacter sp.]
MKALTMLQRDFLQFLELYDLILASPKFRERVEAEQDRVPELVEKCSELMKSYTNAERVVAIALLAKLMIRDAEEFELQRRPVC